MSPWAIIELPRDPVFARTQPRMSPDGSRISRRTGSKWNPANSTAVMMTVHTTETPRFRSAANSSPRKKSSSTMGAPTMTISAKTTMAGRPASATSWSPGGPCLRYAIGLEDPADLIADLERGFARLRG